MRREQHLDTDKYFWAEEYPEVHKWIDSEFPKHVGRRPYRHWLKNHHIEAITKKWGIGTPQYNSAYVHILCDFLSHFSVAYVPDNEKTLNNMLNELGVI